MATPAFQLDKNGRRIFVGLMIGMFVAAISQTIVGPAMPRIIAELGGMEHYSWVATTALLASAITTPIVGKLSDLFGRRRFYLAGLVMFMAGSIVSGIAPTFGVLILGRAIQGMGMGTLMPLSQTIIGDLIPPRFRGRYQGYMGAMFGVATVLGPLAGGAITDAWGWRWLFFVAPPVGLIALAAIARFMHLPHTRREVKIDIAGMITLALGLAAVLLATSWGGSSYPWASAQVLGLFAAGAVLLTIFVFVELRAAEPVLPLRLFRNATFTMANIGALGMAMVMFGVLIYLPVYAQGVVGVDATTSGLILMPLNLGQIFMGVAVGLLITRTGRYKEFMVLGVLLVGVGQWMLTRLNYASSPLDITWAMVVFGIGLGLVLQQFTLVVQNVVPRADLGVATAATQFSRSVGSTVGIAIFGTILNSGLADQISRRLPEGMDDLVEGLDAGAVLDPTVFAGLPGPVAVAVRVGLAEQLNLVFLSALPIVVLVLLATLAIPPLPLRETVHTPDEARREYLDAMSSSVHSRDELLASLSEGRAPRTRERVLGIQFSVLLDQSARDDRPLLRRAVTEVGSGDFERGRRLLAHTARMLMDEDPAVAADSEKYAVEIASLAGRKGGLLSRDLRADLAISAARTEPDRVLEGPEVTVAARHKAVDVTSLTSAGSELASTLLVDILASNSER